MGPGPPNKKGGKKKVKNDSQRTLNAPEPGTSFDGSMDAASTQPGSSPRMDGSQLSAEGDRWNWKRYQRNDEPLWGLHEQHWPGGQRIKSAIAKAGSTAGRLLEQVEGRLSKMSPTDEGEESQGEEEGTYFVARNPPVNDLHPPVVSTRPGSKAETAWMLQPPPSAKIMEGKMRVDSLRSRADSAASSRLGINTPLGRRASEKPVDAKLQRGDLPEPRPTSARTVSRPKTANSNIGQRHERTESSDEACASEEERGRKRIARRIPPPISITPGERSSRDTVIHNRIPSEANETPARLPLSATANSPKDALKTDNGLPLGELLSERNKVLNLRNTSQEKSQRVQGQGIGNDENIVKSENERPSVEGNSRRIET
jgi:hypothetical protein